LFSTIKIFVNKLIHFEFAEEEEELKKWRK